MTYRPGGSAENLSHRSDSEPTGYRFDPSCVSVTRLVLNDFRNFPNVELSLDSRPVVLTGANGAGKTNLLEALSMLAPGRGLRGARLQDLDRNDTIRAMGWALSARLSSPFGPCEIRVRRQEQRRDVTIDDQGVKSQSALAENLSVLWLVPSMDRLFADRASARRRFLDRIVFGIDARHAQRLSAYERALRERAQLLRSGASRADRTWLAALERNMGEQGIAVAAARRATVSRLRRILEIDSGPFPTADVVLSGQVCDWLDEMPAVDAEARLAASLAETRVRDGESGGASIGPHRDDLIVCKGSLPAVHCSTGEQKSLVISVFLAGARLLSSESSRQPIILLDDAGAHLDSDHRAALFDALTEFGGQAWLTGTDRTQFDGFGCNAQFFTVSRGIIDRG